MKVSIAGLAKSYGAATALHDLSMEIDGGQVIALVGANGAGKTTLLRCLATVCAPSRGTIHFDGQPLRRSRLDLRRRLYFLPDFPCLSPWATPVDHIGMVVRLYEKTSSVDADRIFTLLERFDLLACGRAPIASLSRGQAYKTALAALMAVEPELVVLDEPFASGMDPHGTLFFREWARQAVARGTTIIYSTQILEVAEAFADRVAILGRGGLHAFDTLAALRAQSGETSGSVLAAVLEPLRETRR